jgi:hypothetical protein
MLTATPATVPEKRRSPARRAAINGTREIILFISAI